MRDFSKSILGPSSGRILQVALNVFLRKYEYYISVAYSSSQGKNSVLYESVKQFWYQWRQTSAVFTGGPIEFAAVHLEPETMLLRPVCSVATFSKHSWTYASFSRTPLCQNCISVWIPEQPTQWKNWIRSYTIASKFLLILLLSSDSVDMLLFFLASLKASHCLIYLLPCMACFTSTQRCMQIAADRHCPLVLDFSNCLL